MSVFQRGWRGQFRKLAPTRFLDTLALATREDVLVVDWVNRGPVSRNWGDAVAPVIAGRLSGRRVVNRRDVFNLRGRTVYATIGSMLASVDVPGFEVWGTGFVDSRATLKARPGRVHAVRGPLTYKKLVAAGVPCPETFGDPALLLPRLYRPRTEVRYELGVIPHFRERALPAVAALREQGVHIIDICGGIRWVLDEIASCARIASSSLHGLVASDAYCRPAQWVRFSDLPAGDGFKFRDYLASTASRAQAPLLVSVRTTVSEIEDRFEQKRPSIDTEPLLKSCPFLEPARVRADGSIC